MKEGWEIKTLGEVCDILDKLRKPITKSSRVVGDYPYYGATGILSYVDHYIFSEDLVLLGEDGAKWGVGDRSAFIATGKYWVNNHAHVLKPKSDKLEYNWLVHYLNGNDLTPFVTGMTVPKLTQEKMRSIPIPLPPLPEQERIVSIIDKAFEAIDKAIENTQKNLQNAKELFESYLNEVFENGGEDWERKKLGDIASVQYGYTDKSFNEGQFRYIRITDISSDGRLIAEDKKYLADVNKFDLQDYILEHHDLLMARTGATFAKVLLYENFEPSVFASYLIKIKFKVRIENQLFWYFAKTKMYWQQAHHLSSGSAQPQFNGAALKQLEVTYPTDIVKQKELIEEFKELLLKVTQLESQYQQKLRDLEELKKSILNKAFAGEL